MQFQKVCTVVKTVSVGLKIGSYKTQVSLNWSLNNIYKKNVTQIW